MRKKRKVRPSCGSDNNIHIDVNYGLLLDKIEKNRDSETGSKETVPIEDNIFFLKTT